MHNFHWGMVEGTYEINLRLYTFRSGAYAGSFPLSKLISDQQSDSVKRDPSLIAKTQNFVKNDGRFARKSKSICKRINYYCNLLSYVAKVTLKIINISTFASIHTYRLEISQIPMTTFVLWLMLVCESRPSYATTRDWIERRQSSMSSYSGTVRIQAHRGPATTSLRCE